jgi:hypothetical protein
MQFDFYSIDAGELGGIKLRVLGHVEAPIENARATVNRYFDELVANNSATGKVFVVSSFGVVATEVDTSRRLQWVD